MFVAIGFFAALIAPFVQANQPAEARTLESPAELKGTWKLVSVEIGGERTEFTEGRPRWVIQGETVRYGGEDLAVLSGDSTTTPKILDLHLLDPKKAYEGIYTLEKTTLKICLNAQTEGVKERPGVFSTEGREKWRLLVFERAADQEGDVTEGLRGYAGMALKIDEDHNELVVAGVLDGSPAKKAGLRADDVVLRIAGLEVTKLLPAVEAVRRTKPGSDLTVRVNRDGKEVDITVKVGFQPFSILANLE